MKNRIIYSLIFVLFTLISCDENFDEVNIDIDNPTTAPVNGFLAGVQIRLSAEYAEHTYRVVNKIIGYTEQTTRLWDEYLNNGSEEQDFWNAHYLQLKNLDYIINNAREDETNIKAVALIIKSWGYYVVSSLYGDVPYTEAGKGNEGINLPAYDTQQKVFQNILDNLQEANTLLSGTGASIQESEDRLFGGDLLKWRKFANSLRIRVLIAQSKQVDPSSELQRILSDPTTFPIMESNEDQPAFTYNTGDSYPESQGSFHVENTFMGEAFINGLKLLTDQRIIAYANPAANAPDSFAGIPVGNISTVSSDDFSLTSPMILASATVHAVQTVWMSYAELQFLLAEAAETGWISGGTATAKNYYENGIEASYAYQKSRVDFAIANGVSITAMAPWNPGYLSTPGVGYAGDTATKKLLIARQKYIALFNDMESYFSWKRTQLPEIPVNTASPGVLPLRYRYPFNERTFNTENVSAANAVQGPDERSTLMWILK